MNFNPVASKNDIKEISNKEYFNLMVEQKAGVLVDDLQAEVDKLIWCDYFIVVFPFWWSGPPAIMNGWFDRVLACGRTWDFGGYKFEKGLLKGKFGLAVTSVGTPDKYYRPDQIAKQTIKRRLFFINHGTFGFCGVKPLETIHLHSARATEEERKKDLDNLAEQIKNINYLPLYDYSSW